MVVADETRATDHCRSGCASGCTIAGARGFVVGLSGGVDSAVVVRLCQAAAPGNVVGVMMPCHSDPRDEADARLVADRISASRPSASIWRRLRPSRSRMLSDALPALPAAQSPDATARPDDREARVPFANVKPRLRMTTLYFVANTLNYLVAGTGNRSELSIGYFTKYGDGGVDLLPIGEPAEERGARTARSELGRARRDHRQGAERRPLGRADRRGAKWGSPTRSSRAI